MLVVEDEWGISHWPGDTMPSDRDYLSDDEAREKWKARVVADLGENKWSEVHDD